jgi:N-acetyl-alpha-D-muramate 1-phosphate uridylyltransferase
LSKPVKKAMILAAGFGTRLRPLTDNIPKALVPHKGKPMLENVINKLIFSGINYIVINTHHFSEQIFDFIEKNKFDADIKLIHEKEILGTGGGIKNAAGYFDDADEFLVYNADVDCDIDLSEMYSKFNELNPLALLAVQNRETKRHLLIDKDDRLIGRTVNGEDKIYYKDHSSVQRTSFCGIHILSSGIFPLMPAEENFDIILFYMKVLNERNSIFTYDLKQIYWNDLGAIDSLKQ